MKRKAEEKGKEGKKKETKEQRKKNHKIERWCTTFYKRLHEVLKNVQLCTGAWLFCLIF
ncbi:MAG: hypothetical protein BSOLF_2284 [Candidatus Carbobacillus altaicus]|uniref:Uncharacterized protein n=1 Tax=Candidatus Carbonibacillus altaicus TaxID=2163959 RepID=A0A2R6XY85_9BACL|nr:MAG: hypothetical protein BSOLF_2284 [Candidatus Carbobacillus altaicus]